MALDNKKSCAFEDIYTHIERGDILEWLEITCNCDFSLLNDALMREERGQIIGALRAHSVGRKGGERRKLGVENNGLCLLIGLVIDIICSERINTSYYNNFYVSDDHK